ncbi:MAG: zf-HC2 domain-containing protein [Candidatus Zixiibacteriota bacterium]
MSKCSNPELAVKLHAWELNLLSEDERQAVEEHILVCEACFEQARQFSEPIGLLRRDDQVRRLIADASQDLALESESHAVGKSFWTRIVALPTLARYLAAAAVLVLVAVTVFRIAWFDGSDSGPVQVITLTTTRAVGSSVIEREAGGMAQIRFYVPTEGLIFPLRVEIFTLDGESVVSERVPDPVDSMGYGRISLPVRSLAPGVYRLRLFSGGAGDDALIREYSFLVR